MNVEAYLTAIKAKLVNSVIIKHFDIVQEYVIREQGFFRARLTLQNDDFLEVAEFFQEFQGEVQTVEYRYQWIDRVSRNERDQWTWIGKNE